MGDFRKKFQQFKEDIEQDVIDKQKEIAKLTMDVLFENAPHCDLEVFLNWSADLNENDDQVGYVPFYDMRIPSWSATSWYDANFKLTTSSNPTPTSMAFPTFDKDESKLINKTEAERVNSITKIGETVHITNIVLHAMDVEIGGPEWRRDGYHTFEKTIAFVKARSKQAVKRRRNMRVSIQRSCYIKRHTFRSKGESVWDGGRHFNDSYQLDPGSIV